LRGGFEPSGPEVTAKRCPLAGSKSVRCFLDLSDSRGSGNVGDDSLKRSCSPLIPATRRLQKSDAGQGQSTGRAEGHRRQNLEDLAFPRGRQTAGRTGVITLSVTHAKSGIPITALVAVIVATTVMWLLIVLVARLGGSGRGFVRDTVTRFMGLIVIAMGVQFALSGVRSFMLEPDHAAPRAGANAAGVT
jgi:hypothetical protein